MQANVSCQNAIQTQTEAYLNFYDLQGRRVRLEVKVTDQQKMFYLLHLPLCLGFKESAFIVIYDAPEFQIDVFGQ